MLTFDQKSIFNQGDQIDSRFEILKTLGKGGMGVVYLVKDLTLDMEFSAIKVLHPSLYEDKVNLERFINEVVLVRRLSHPNIVRIFDLKPTPDNVYYINMEYVKGETLSYSICSGSPGNFSISEVCMILVQILNALSAAHKAKVVHRDLKPDNILFSSQSVVKVMDFGLSSALDAEKKLTQTGETVGTPNYMAPEQFAGAEVDGRADIYSLGIIAFELVALEKPFISENYLELARMHMSDEVPVLSSYESQVPGWYDEFVKICLSKKKEDRFKNTSEALEFIYIHSEDTFKEAISLASPDLSFLGLM
jgi:serine/threonine protein kinase